MALGKFLVFSPQWKASAFSLLLNSITDVQCFSIPNWKDKTSMFHYESSANPEFSKYYCVKALNTFCLLPWGYIYLIFRHLPKLTSLYLWGEREVPPQICWFNCASCLKLYLCGGSGGSLLHLGHWAKLEHDFCWMFTIYPVHSLLNYAQQHWVEAGMDCCSATVCGSLSRYIHYGYHMDIFRIKGWFHKRAQIKKPCLSPLSVLCLHYFHLLKC